MVARIYKLISRPIISSCILWLYSVKMKKETEDIT